MTTKRWCCGTLMLLGALGCQTADLEKASTAPRRQPDTMTLESRMVPKTLSFVGTIVAPRDAVLASTRGGRVEAYLHEVGHSVVSGDVLIKLGASELAFASQAAAASATQAAARIGAVKSPESLPQAQAAKTAYELAADASRRAERLHTQGSISEQELTRARADEASARAQYEGALAESRVEFGRLRELRATAGQAHVALGDQTIRAPFAGVVIERFAEVGQMAAAGAPLVRVIDLSELRVRFEIPQFDADKVAMGGRVQVLSAAALASSTRGAEVIFEGTVVRTTPGLVGESNARWVEAALVQSEQPEGAPKLLPGARLPTWLELDEQEEIIEVPRSATTSTAGVVRAWIVAEGRLEERLLSVARIKGDVLAVRAGLRAGEQLVQIPQADFRLGEAVVVEASKEQR